MRSGITFLLLASVVCLLQGQIHDDLKIAALRVSFHSDQHSGTTGNGQFLIAAEYDTCGNYAIDPPPHDSLYFQAQLTALNNYYRQVSYGQFGLDTINSIIYPKGSSASYQLSDSMSHYHRYGEEDIHEQRLTELLRDAVTKAYEKDTINFSVFDLIVVFHAGIGQDFSLPYIDPTPEDIPSTYIDPVMVYTHIGNEGIVVGDNIIEQGIILPETQNHLLYEDAEDIFLGAAEPCDYQYGLTGTFALMVGFAVGLPPLWNIETGKSGIGIFGLMDQGSNNGRGLIPAPPDAWTRVLAGWEEPLTVIPGSDVILPARSQGNQIRVAINRDEYFLIENRTNWIHGNVSIDSLRWKLYNEDKEIHPDDARYPPLVEILIDSVDVVIDDSTGVIISVPDYDLGLPASGLLIWHIDEQIIRNNQAGYAINADPDYKGVDLEEADGAQDLGFASIFLFTDPSSGLFADMWYQGNPEYERLYPERSGQPLVFGPYTYPDTRSNSGAATNISINHIGPPGDTMIFRIDNILIADNFPDTTLHIQLLADFTGDGIAEIIGGRDSLWWSPAEMVQKTNIWPLKSNDFEVVATNYDAALPNLILVTDIGDSIKVHSFQLHPFYMQFIKSWSQTIALAGFNRIEGNESANSVRIHFGEQIYTVDTTETTVEENPRPKLYTEIGYSAENGNLPIGVYYDENEELTVLDENGSIVAQLSQPGLTNISVIDLDLDGRAEILLVTDDGSVACYNTNLTLEVGFPVVADAHEFILARNLVGDTHPELIVLNSNGEILVIDWRGQIIYRLANSIDNALQMVTDFRGRSSIITGSTIWSFDSLTVTEGNEWNRQNGNMLNDRKIHLVTPASAPSSRLFDPASTYAYPNPSRTNYVKLRVFVESAEEIVIKIYDLAGLHIIDFHLSDLVPHEVNEISWDVTNVESGVYFGYLEARKGNEIESEILKIGIIH
ncbi:MAG: hypothetical protein H8E14_14665 [Candidatus Marinimicrobia bacterium]|nr:hypothetical protein [Candidatus Neomarinimicrobiota bacterium]